MLEAFCESDTSLLGSALRSVALLCIRLPV